MSIGWISLHRKFIDWEWYDDNKTKALFIHCLLKANHKTKEWHGNTIPRGTFITSYSSLSKETGLSTRELRTAFEKLEQTGEIDKESTSVNSWVTVINYDEYQDIDKVETKQRQASDKVETTTNNDNNENNVNKYNYGTPDKLKDQQINHTSFIEAFNELYDRHLRVTDKKREMIRGRLRTFTGAEIKKAWENRLHDNWLNGEGKEYLGNWKAAMRNDEKIEKYLHAKGSNGLDNNILRKHAKNK